MKGLEFIEKTYFTSFMYNTGRSAPAANSKLSCTCLTNRKQVMIMKGREKVNQNDRFSDQFETVFASHHYEKEVY